MNIIQQVYERYQARDDPRFPNKCDTCGLRVEYLGDGSGAEQTLLEVAKLSKFGLARYPPRVMDVGGGNPGTTYFCALAHTKYWVRKDKRCPDWQLRIPHARITLADYMSIHHSRTNARIAKWVGAVASVWAIIAIGVAAWLTKL